jgi:hypothetical protein
VRGTDAPQGNLGGFSLWWVADRWTKGIGMMRPCNEIVMVGRSKRIIPKQNGPNLLICNALKSGVE